MIFGSTAKMGVGTNIQKRAIAPHHMDAPWRAGDIKQQYLTEGSSNAYPCITLRGAHSYTPNVNTENPLGTLQSIENVARNLHGHLDPWKRRSPKKSKSRGT